MAGFRTYDPNAMLMVIGDASVEFGKGSGVFLEIQYNSPVYGDPVIGVDGEVAIAKSNDRSATITVTLMQDSPHNVAFSALVNTTLLSPGGAGGLPVFIKRDNQIFEGEKLIVKERPTYTFSNQPEERAWVFFCADLREVTSGPLT